MSQVGSHYGQIKTLNKSKGFGFIVSSDFEGDVWFNTNQLPELPEERLRGAHVTFEAQASRDNPKKVRATRAQLLTAEADPLAAVAAAATAAQVAPEAPAASADPVQDAQAWQAVMMQLGMEATRMLGLDLGTLQGLIAAYSSGDAAGANAGTNAGANAGVNAGVSAAPEQSTLQVYGTEDAATIEGVNAAGATAQSHSIDVAQAAAAASQSGHHGTIKTLNKAKGFGFIASTSFGGRDVWFNTNSLPPEYPEEYLRGAPVCFEASLTRDDPPKVRATTVSLPLADGSISAITPTPAPFSTMSDQAGVIKAFNGTYGFIVSNSPELTLDGIYFKAHDFREIAPEQITKGIPVIFDVKFHRDGKPQASNIRISSGGSPSGTKRPGESLWDMQAPPKRGAYTV